MGLCSTKPAISEERTNAAKLAKQLGQSHLASIKDLISFLFAVDTVDTALPEGLYDENILLEACRRYETLWLPLLITKHDNQKDGTPLCEMVPPIDVAWVWYVHRLNPEAYDADIRRVFRAELPTTYKMAIRTLPLALPRLLESDSEFHKIMTITRYKWDHSYANEPYSPESLFAQADPSLIPAVAQGWKSQFTYDIVSAARRQKEMVRNSFAPVILTSLKYALIRYSRFLVMAKQAQLTGQKLVPMADIQLAWASHLCCTHDYRFFLQLSGIQLAKLSYDDVCGSGGSDRAALVKQTAAKYEALFKTPYKVAPGPPPKGPRALNITNTEAPPWPVRPYRPDWGFSRITPPDWYHYDKRAPQQSINGNSPWARDHDGAYAPGCQFIIGSPHPSGIWSGDYKDSEVRIAGNSFDNYNINVTTAPHFPLTHTISRRTSADMEPMIGHGMGLGGLVTPGLSRHPSSRRGSENGDHGPMPGHHGVHVGHGHGTHGHIPTTPRTHMLGKLGSLKGERDSSHHGHGHGHGHGLPSLGLGHGHGPHHLPHTHSAPSHLHLALHAHCPLMGTVTEGVPVTNPEELEPPSLVGGHHVGALGRHGSKGDVHAGLLPSPSVRGAAHMTATVTDWGDGGIKGQRYKPDFA